jgi:LPS sulfotransferase NodH
VHWALQPQVPKEPTTPTRSLLLCCTPRCGSWLLADLLDQSGVAGRPHEWFWRDTVARNKAAWGVSSDEDSFASVLAAGTTPNGVFAVKLMWRAFETVLPLRFPAPRFVWLRRDEEAAQAVSFWRAVASGHWHMWDPPARAAEYDPDAIAHLLGEIREQNASWDAWFAAHGVAPFDLRYEALAADPDGEARRVLSFLEVELPAFRLVPRVERAAANDDWVERFRAVP